MRRTFIVIALASLMVLAGAGVALAGEWNPGNFDAPGGDLPAKFNARSECVGEACNGHLNPINTG